MDKICTFISDIAAKCMYLAYKLDFWRASHTSCTPLLSCGSSSSACGGTPALQWWTTMIMMAMMMNLMMTMCKNAVHWGHTRSGNGCPHPPFSSGQLTSAPSGIGCTLKSALWKVIKNKAAKLLFYSHLKVVDQPEPAGLGLVAAEKTSKLLWWPVDPGFHICLLNIGGHGVMVVITIVTAICGQDPNSDRIECEWA